jgi:hypothetical protein
VLNFDQACEIRDAVLEDADSGSFDRLELTPARKFYDIHLATQSPVALETILISTPS